MMNLQLPVRAFASRFLRIGLPRDLPWRLRKLECLALQHLMLARTQAAGAMRASAPSDTRMQGTGSPVQSLRNGDWQAAYFSMRCRLLPRLKFGEFYQNPTRRLVSGQSPERAALVTFGIFREVTRTPSPWPPASKSRLQMPLPGWRVSVQRSSGSKYLGLLSNTPPKNWRSACRISQAITDPGMIWIVTSSHAAKTGPTLGSTRAAGLRYLR
jgi:hypothetical protein